MLPTAYDITNAGRCDQRQTLLVKRAAEDGPPEAPRKTPSSWASSPAARLIGLGCHNRVDAVPG
jgi:hypothetical protein